MGALPLKHRVSNNSNTAMTQIKGGSIHMNTMSGAGLSG